MEGATGWTRAYQSAHHRLGEGFNRFPHTGRGCALGAVDRQKRFHHGHGNFGGLERNHGAIAADDLVVRQGAAHRGGGEVLGGGRGLHGGRVRADLGVLHGFFSSFVLGVGRTQTIPGAPAENDSHDEVTLYLVFDSSSRRYR